MEIPDEHEIPLYDQTEEKKVDNQENFNIAEDVAKFIKISRQIRREGR